MLLIFSQATFALLAIIFRLAEIYVASAEVLEESLATRPIWGSERFLTSIVLGAVTGLISVAHNRLLGTLARRR